MPKTAMSRETRERACLLFLALSNPTRVRIVELLFDGERTVGEVAEEVGIGQSGASQHLALLARAGLLKCSARGTSRVYRIRGPRIEKIVGLIQEFCEVHGLYGDAGLDEEGL